MGIKVYSLICVMQDLYHQPYGGYRVWDLGFLGWMGFAVVLARVWSARVQEYTVGLHSYKV